MIDHTVGLFFQQRLDERVNTERPGLEVNIANQLAANEGVFEVSTEPLAEGQKSDFEYIRDIAENLAVDNLFKGQILERFDA